MFLHQKRLMGSIILVPLRPQEGRFMNVFLILHHSRIDFLVKQGSRRNHRNQSPTSRPLNRGPPQGLLQFFQSTKPNVSFILCLPHLSKKPKRLWLLQQSTLWWTVVHLTVFDVNLRRHRTKSQMVDRCAP